MKYIFYFIFKFCFFKLIISEKCEKFCSSEGGQCIKDIKCKCKEGYTSNYIDEEFLFCNYKKYNKITAGLIELFFGFGMGHFYCNRNLNGFIQLGGEVISYWLMIILIFPFYIYDHVFNFHIPYCIFSYVKFYCPLFVVLIFSWQIVDSLLFLFKFYKDGNGIDLY